MEKLSDDVLDIIYRKKHELEFYDVLQCLNWSPQHNDEYVNYDSDDESEPQFTDDIDGQIDRMLYYADLDHNSDYE